MTRMTSAFRTVERRCAITKRGAALQEVREGPLDGVLGLRIERRGGFVQDEDARVAEDLARDRDPLALPRRQLHAALADAGLEALREARG